MTMLARSQHAWILALVAIVGVSIGSGAADVVSQTQSAMFVKFIPLNRISLCTPLICPTGTQCTLNKCNAIECVPLCTLAKCQEGQVCKVADKKATCITDPCTATACPTAQPHCVVVNGEPQCRTCPVGVRNDPVCCQRGDGSITTEDSLACGCQDDGVPLYRGECSASCTCPPRAVSPNDVCCRLKDGSKQSIPVCECLCRGGSFGAPTPILRQDIV
jgi:hypothetical protein